MRAPEPEEPASLCLNCHSLLHEADPAQRDNVVVFAPGQHDDQPRLTVEPCVVPADCNLCHSTDLLAIHADRCSACHPAPYDTVDTWARTCQQAGCHIDYHLGSPEAHDPWSAYSDYSDPDCMLCHYEDYTVSEVKCLGAVYLHMPGEVYEVEY